MSKIDKRHAKKRVRKAFNNVETIPTTAGNKYVHCGWGEGAGVKQLQPKLDCDLNPDEAWDEMIIEWTSHGERCASCIEYDTYCYCMSDTEAGEGWSLESANDNNPPKLGDLFAA